MLRRLAVCVSIVFSAGAGFAAAQTPYGGTAAQIPGQIEAENFDDGGPGVAYYDTTSGNAGGAYRSTDVDIEPSSEGGYDVGWMAATEWLNYTVNVASAGSYTVQLRVASQNGGGSLHIGFNNASNVWTSVVVPNTGSWQSWTTVSVPVTLGAGTQLMTIYVDTAGVNLDYINVVSGSSSSGGSGGSASSGVGPYSGSPAPVPGRIEAENFDNGGQGVGYYDATLGNAGGAYRSTDVDIEPSSEGGYDVGWLAAAEWMNYTVNVSSSGSYTVQLRVASPGGGALHVGFNGPSNVWTQVSIPATGGWQDWTTVNVPVSLGAGQQQMTLYIDSPGFNIDYVDVSSGGAASASGGSQTSAVVATWNIQVDDSSSWHASTAIDYLMAMNPQPQIIVIQEAHQSQYDTYLSELRNRTGANWQGVFKTHCPPGAWNGSWCTSSEDEGVGIFTSYPIVDSDGIFLPYADQYHSARALVRAAVDVNGVTVQVFGTHLQTTATPRYESMSLIKSYASNYSSPQIAAGDFNADMDQIDTTSGMLPSFVDSWSVVGSGSGYTCSTPSPTMKLDYWFGDASSKARPQWSAVVTTPGTFSDHYPVLNSFSFSQ